MEFNIDGDIQYHTDQTEKSKHIPLAVDGKMNIHMDDLWLNHLPVDAQKSMLSLRVGEALESWLPGAGTQQQIAAEVTKPTQLQGDLSAQGKSVPSIDPDTKEAEVNSSYAFSGDVEIRTDVPASADTAFRLSMPEIKRQLVEQITDSVMKQLQQ